ncbi:hypothetical protein ACJX0J_005901, partial [Zea mays]
NMFIHTCICMFVNPTLLDKRLIENLVDVHFVFLTIWLAAGFDIITLDLLNVVVACELSVGLADFSVSWNVYSYFLLTLSISFKKNWVIVDIGIH